MKKTSRLALDLLIVGGVLLFGSFMAPRGGGGWTTPGGGGYSITVPGNHVEHKFVLRGQTYTMTFWGCIRTSPDNVTFLPVDLYVMSLDQYLGFVDSQSRQAILHVTSSLDTIIFKPEKSGHYFFILEKLEPVGLKCAIGKYDELKGVILDFQQPALALLIPGIAILTYNQLQRLKKSRFKSQISSLIWFKGY